MSFLSLGRTVSSARGGSTGSFCGERPASPLASAGGGLAGHKAGSTSASLASQGTCVTPALTASFSWVRRAAAPTPISNCSPKTRVEVLQEAHPQQQHRLDGGASIIQTVAPLQNGARHRQARINQLAEEAVTNGWPDELGRR